jgi:hypothetical protein
MELKKAVKIQAGFAMAKGVRFFFLNFFQRGDRHRREVPWLVHNTTVFLYYISTLSELRKLGPLTGALSLRIAEHNTTAILIPFIASCFSDVLSKPVVAISCL